MSSNFFTFISLIFSLYFPYNNNLIILLYLSYNYIRIILLEYHYNSIILFVYKYSIEYPFNSIISQLHYIPIHYFPVIPLSFPCCSIPFLLIDFHLFLINHSFNLLSLIHSLICKIKKSGCSSTLFLKIEVLFDCSLYNKLCCLLCIYSLVSCMYLL